MQEHGETRRRSASTLCSAVRPAAAGPQCANAVRNERIEWQMTQWCGSSSAPPESVAQRAGASGEPPTGAHSRSSSAAWGATDGASQTSSRQAASHWEDRRWRRKSWNTLSLRVTVRVVCGQGPEPEAKARRGKAPRTRKGTPLRPVASSQGRGDSQAVSTSNRTSCNQADPPLTRWYAAGERD